MISSFFSFLSDFPYLSSFVLISLSILNFLSYNIIEKFISRTSIFLFPRDFFSKCLCLIASYFYFTDDYCTLSLWEPTLWFLWIFLSLCFLQNYFCVVCFVTLLFYFSWWGVFFTLWIAWLMLGYHFRCKNESSKSMPGKGLYTGQTHCRVRAWAFNCFTEGLSNICLYRLFPLRLASFPQRSISVSFLRS